MKARKPIPSAIKMKTKKVKDYILVIQNAEEVFELYNANIQLEMLKGDLLKKMGSKQDDDKIMAEINLAYKLQDLCKRRV
jgi:hypothetical protein